MAGPALNPIDSVLSRWKELLPAERALVVLNTTSIPDGRSELASTPPLEVRAEFVEWLCLSSELAPYYSHRSIVIERVTIIGRINLTFATLLLPLTFLECTAPGGIDLHGAQLRNLQFDGGSYGLIDADACRIQHDLLIGGGVVVNDGLLLRGAEIKGSIISSGVTLLCPGGKALNAERLEVGGSVLFERNFYSCGEVRLINATIGGNLEIPGGRMINRSAYALEAEQIEVGGSVLLLRGFRAVGAITLSYARIGANVSVSNARILNRGGTALNLSLAEVGGYVSLSGGFRSYGAVECAYLALRGSFVGDGSRLRHGTGNALNLGSARIGGAVFLRKVITRGQVHMINVHVIGNVEMDGSRLGSGQLYSLNLSVAKIGGSVFLRNALHADGPVTCSFASIGANLECSNSDFSGTDAQPAISGFQVNVKGSILLSDQFTARGKVLFAAANVGVNWNCDGGRFINPKGRAIDAERINVGAYVSMDHGFTSHGEVHLLNGTVGGNVQARGGRFLNRGGRSLNLSGVQVSGNIILVAVRAYGEVWLVGTRVSNNVNFSESGVHNAGKTSVNANRLGVAGQTLFRKFRSNGVITMKAARLERDLNFEDATFQGDYQNGLHAESTTIGGTFIWSHVTVTPQTQLHLLFTRATQFIDDEASWPHSGQLALAGFVYQAISGGPSSSQVRLRWLQRGAPETFDPQPFEVLRKFFVESGREVDAQRVSIARVDAFYHRAQISLIMRLWGVITRVTLGYGYRPQRALLLMLVFVGIGWAIFRWGWSERLMVPTRERVYLDSTYRTVQKVPDSYPAFDPLLYSLDVLLPVVDLHQEAYWTVNANRTCDPFSKPARQEYMCGLAARNYEAVHLLVGWALSTLLVVGFTGLVRKA